MKALPKRKGNGALHCFSSSHTHASMKALPKRKGNIQSIIENPASTSLNESPSEKEGKFSRVSSPRRQMSASMKALPKRKGNVGEFLSGARVCDDASMKALPKRKGNFPRVGVSAMMRCLNESPSEKEGKYASRPSTGPSSLCRPQ